MAISIKTSLQRKGNGIKSENAIAYFKGLSENKVSSGFHKDVGVEILKRAINTEFGGIIYFAPHKHYVTAPPRPIVRMYLYPEMKNKITKTYAQSINEEKDTKLKTPNNNIQNTFKKIGEDCVYMQKERIFLRDYDNSTNDTPFDPNYNGIEIVMYKGFDHPWIQTGKTVEAINYKVEKR